MLALFAAAVVVAVLLAGLPSVRRGLGARTLTPLLLVGIGLGVWAVVTAMPGLGGIVQASQQLPGGGLLRDAQKWLAPWWLVCALAFGAAARRMQLRIRPGDGARVLPYALALVPLVLLPELAFAAFGRLTPARYPEGWELSRSALVQSADDDLVVALPWSTFRRYEWNDDRTVLDPAPRYLPRTVVTDTTLLVSGANGSLVAVPGDDGLSQRVASALRADDPVAGLRELGIGWIFVQPGQPSAPGAPVIPDLTGAVPAVRTLDVELYRIPGTVVGPPRASAAPVLVAWLVSATVAGAAAVCVALGRRRRGSRETAARV